MAEPKAMIPAWVDGRLVPVEKLEVHLRGLRHKAVSVFVFAGDRLLVQRRSESKYHTPGLWANTCCTHPRWGESGEACAVRRLEEELGLTGLEPEARGTLTYSADVGGGMVEHEEVELFRVRLDGVPQVRANPEEVAEVDWLTLEDLAEEIARGPERFTPWLRIYMARHMDMIEG